MNKYFGIFLAAVLCLFMAACARETVPPETEPFEPSLSTDIESDVEPLEISQIEPESEPEILIVAEPETGSGDVVVPEAVIIPEPSETLQEPQQPAQAQSPAPEIRRSPPQTETEDSRVLYSVSPDKKLDTKIIERELLRLVNALREEAGAETLGIEDDMEFASRIRAIEALQSFSHTRPDGSPYNTAFDEAGFSYAGKWHGENLASLQFTEGMFDEKAVALEMFTSLKNSPGHYRNMVGENFLQAGIGVYCDYGDGFVSVASAQLFSSL